MILRGIPTVISSDLLKALADTGHADLIVVADANYPPISKTPNGLHIHAKGNNTIEMIDAILTLMPLDSDYCDHPFLYMGPDQDSGIVMERAEVWDEAFAVLEKHGYKAECAQRIERMKFYKKASKAFLTLSTSDARPYSCFILQRGVF